MNMRGLSVMVMLVFASIGVVHAADAGRQERMLQLMDERFAAADINGDGHLTAAEAQGKMPFVARHFEELDKEKHGSVTLDELRAYLADRSTRKTVMQ